MCGIIGYFGTADSASQTKKIAAGLAIIQDRGRDGFGITDGSDVLIAKKPDELAKFKAESPGVIGHCLHSVAGYLPQPLLGDGSALATNCEIYNWRSLDAKYGLNARNDAELVLKLLDKTSTAKIISALEELDGAYALAYLRAGKLYLARDIIGLKPLWYSAEAEGGGRGISFCSESKALAEEGLPAIQELDPRQVLVYDTETRKTRCIHREFFKIQPEHKKRYEQLKKEVQGLLVNAVAKRIPDQKFGILFSGGVDSTLIALICRELGAEFTCYTAGLVETGMKDPEDVLYARKIAKQYGFDLRVSELTREDAERLLKKVVPLIEDNNVVKAGVALTFYAACQRAREDGVRVMFSGLGSEELFAGYERHKLSDDVNKECLSGMLRIYERDNYRDDVVTTNNNIELRAPFMDRTLAEYCLKIPARYKLDDKRNKIILRDTAKDMGLEAEYADRPKRAAQYGSRFDKALRFLTRKHGFDRKSDYLRQFYPKAKLRLAALFSSGKDSCLAMDIMRKQNYKIECLVTLRSKNPDSYMFHTPNVDLASLQAEAMDIPIISWETRGEKEKELEDLKSALQEARMRFHIEGVVCGAISSTYQRDRVEKICGSLGLKTFAPLWHVDQEREMRQLLDSGFEFVLSSVAAEGLDKSWLGRKITYADVDRLAAMNRRVGINIAGEGGEFESLVLDGPMFKKRIAVRKARIAAESENTARYIVERAELEDKG